MIGKTLGHYEILDLLGEGGMGEVYRARDTTLDRDVALKVLPAEMSEDPDRLARFEREAKTLAALDHPNIITIHTVEQADGTYFFTMQLVEGDTLSDLIPRTGMPLERALEVAIPVVDALASAHERGVIHRDLKPSNVMLSREGRVKILDFGLAKLRRISLREAGTEILTEPFTEEGRVLGTLPYMSPEQLRGREVDHLSDIFSVGVLLHQLVSGRRPFAGVSDADLISSILNQSPPPLNEINPNLPRELGSIVERCLEKEPHDRYQTAAEIRRDLESLEQPDRFDVDEPGHRGVLSRDSPESRRIPTGRRTRGNRPAVRWIAVVLVAVALLAYLIGRREGPYVSGDAGRSPAGMTTAAAVSRPNSIAVLPFADLSPDQDQEYFSDGVSEELLSLLARIPELRVTSRTSAFSFRDSNLEISEIAARLDVAYLLEGSVRKDGDRVRITAQLIEADSDTHLWSETYDRTLVDIFAIQDEIAADVVAQLRVTLLGEPPRIEPTDPRSYSLFLRARQLRQQRTPADSERAISLLEEALEIDPDYATGWTELALLLWRRGNFGSQTPAEACQQALEAIDQALVLDADSALANARLGFLAMTCKSDLETAARQFERALSLEPSNVEALRTAALLAWGLGRVEEAIALLESLVARDPVNARVRFTLSLSHYFDRNWDESLASSRQALALSPQLPGPRLISGLSLLATSEPEASLLEVEQEPLEPARMIGLAATHHALGSNEKSDAVLAELIEKYERVAAYNIAYVLAYRNEPDRAFEWIQKARKHSDPGISQIALEPMFSNIHSDPRWLPMLESLGKSPEQLAKIDFSFTLPE